MTAPDFFLLIPFSMPGVSLRPGTPLSSSTDARTIAAIQAEYGTNVVLWPGSDAVVAKAVAACAALQRNRDDSFLSSVLLAAAVQSVLLGAAAAEAAVLQAATATIVQADLAGLGAGVKTFDRKLTYGSAGLTVLPAGARLFALPSAEGWTGFDDPTHAVVQARVGTSAGGSQIGAAVAVDVTTGTGFPKAFAAGGYAGMAIGGAELFLRVSSTADLNTLTVGAITARGLFTVQP
jgi:hypothetical protein